MAVNEDLSASWNGLTNTIRGVGQDNYNATLGLAKFMGEEQTRTKELELNDIKLQEDKLRLNKIKAKEDFLNQPATLSLVGNMVTGGKPIDASALEKIHGIMKMANVGVTDENNPDPNQQLVFGKDKKPMSMREVGFVAQPIAVALASVNDPMADLTEKVTKSKQKLGLQSAGAFASQAELDQLKVITATDPEKKALFDAYQKDVNDYARYQKDPRPLYIANKKALSWAQGILKSLDGDTTTIDNALKEQGAVIDYLDKSRQVTKRQSDVTGAPEGDFYPVKEAVDIGKAVQTSDSTAATNAAHLQATGMQIAAQREAANNASKQSALSTEHNQVQSSLNPLLAAEAFDKSWQVGPNGLRQSIDPTTKEVVTLSQGEYEALKNKAVQTHIDNLKQEYQYNGTAKRLGITFPETFKAPLQTRREFGAVDKEVKGVLKNINDPNFTANINSMLQQATQALKNEDPKVWDEGRNLLLQAKTLTAKQVEAKKRNIPNGIKQVVKDNSTGLNAWGYDSPN